jgi:hypothetical protein
MTGLNGCSPNTGKAKLNFYGTQREQGINTMAFDECQIRKLKNGQNKLVDLTWRAGKHLKPANPLPLKRICG